LDGPWKLLNQVEEWVNAGIKVYSCYGPGWYWYAISPVVVGGVSIFGGSGSVYGAAIGAVIFAVLQNGVQLLEGV
jgi:ABC-type xylose transport system permease subunit